MLLSNNNSMHANQSLQTMLLSNNNTTWISQSRLLGAKEFHHQRDRSQGNQPSAQHLSWNQVIKFRRFAGSKTRGETLVRTNWVRFGPLFFGSCVLFSSWIPISSPFLAKLVPGNSSLGGTLQIDESGSKLKSFSGEFQ
jgi:hypothetical protein